MKKLVPIIVLLTLAVAWTVCTHAATQDDFTLTVLKDNNPVREFNGEVAIPFDTEYKLRLKNSNHRRCSATVWIDGAKASEIGNFIIDSTDYLDLERFLDRSLTEGKRFKFVPLDHPDVDDPNRVENGIIKVEFRLEKLAEIMPKDNFYYKHLRTPYNLLELDISSDMTMVFGVNDMLTITIDTGTLTTTVNSLTPNDSWITDASTLCSATSAGATVPGSYSSQAFYKVDFDGEDEIVTLQLKMVGI